MTLLIFILVLSVLVLIHEFGHYLVARKNGIRVKEFGLGYPPRVLKLFHYRGTDFTLNLIPLGGFVQLEGEDGPDDEEIASKAKMYGDASVKLYQDARKAAAEANYAEETMNDRVNAYKLSDYTKNGLNPEMKEEAREDEATTGETTTTKDNSAA